MSLDVAAKIDIAKKKKEAGDTAFKAGDTKEGLAVLFTTYLPVSQCFYVSFKRIS